MSNQRTKIALKEAREAIKNKDYHSAMKLCKNVLKEEKDNYMALVFLGVSLQEVGPTEQAPNAFRKAIHSNPTNLLAWNGLLNYFEKIATDTEASKKELIQIYVSLLGIENAEKKVVEYCEKIAVLVKEVNPVHDYQKIASALKRIAGNENSFSETTRNSALNSLAAFLSSLSDVSEDLSDVREDCLANLVSNSKTVTRGHFADYLSVLYKQGKYEALFENAKRMRALYEDDFVCLEWICKVYNELEIEGSSLTSRLFDEVPSICDALLKTNAESSMGLFTRAVLLCKDGSLLEAKEHLAKVTSLRPGLLHAWVLFSQCLLRLGLNQEAVESARKADKLLASINNSNPALRSVLDNVLLDALSRTDDEASWNLVIAMCKVSDNTRSMPPLIRAHINLGNFEIAEGLLAGLDDHEYVLLRTHLLKRRGKLRDALDYLENRNPNDSSDAWNELGMLYWELGSCDKCLVPFLKAAKLNPNSYACFLNLARYYQRFGDLDKARRCYEKAFKINGKSEDAAVELSKIYREQKNWDANLALLQSLTGERASGWAWIQLGLSYLEQGDHNNAINTLRYVIRTDPQNSSCWESLADAYVARGAYTSSLKSYQKAAELNPSSLYPQLQIANIKQLLGEYFEARADFEKIASTNKHYIPALKGLSETCMNLARQHRRNQLIGRARDCAQSALDSITIALERNSNMSCLWKLAGDSCFLVATLPERYCCMLVLRALAEGRGEPGNVPLERNDLYVLAARCYCKAMSLIDDNVLIWHDLAECYLSHARSLPDGAGVLCDRALAAVQHCVTVNTTHWQHWNLMGNVAYFKKPKNYALAQHAFIKAVTVEKNSAMTWCNLGALYLELGEVKLANKAFGQAQRADPNYVDSWVGQALIAESLDHEDAMDLFRHSTQLGPQQEGAVGYGYWVCRTLLEAPAQTNVYSIHNMHAIPVACDALTWYTENDPDDPCAWNMLGILRERMGLKSGTAQAFRNALRLCSRDKKDHANVNYGRSLIRLGKYSQAVEMYKDVRQATFNSGSGLALALFKDRQYEESYEAYESALHWLTDEQGFQSDLLVALASMAYLFQGPDAAKTLLFQSTQLESPSPWGLYATLSLGLLHEDLNLAHLVLKELEKFRDDPKYLPHYAVLISSVYLVQGKGKQAVCELSKLLHRHPEQASLWLSLSILLLKFHRKMPTTALAAARCAQIAMKLGQTNMDVTKVLCLVTLGLFLKGDDANALKSAQQAVHYFPNVPECWAVLICTLLARSQNDAKFAGAAKLQDRINHVKNALSPSPALAAWLQAQA